MKSDICNICGEHKPGNISTNGICEKCCWDRMKESAKQIKNRYGPFYKRWKEGIRRSTEK